MTVCVLPSKIQNRLRSGIAVTSFGRCVEELVLNSLDANATCVAVKVNTRDFRLRVIDNGRAVDGNHFELMGKRYATSKCRPELDADDVCNFGYRGEALASIIDSSRTVRIESRSKESDETFCKVFYDGKLSHVTSVHKLRPCPGVSVTVEDFLYNLPVRRLRISETLDFQDIKLRISRIALMHPGVSFSLQNEINNTIGLKSAKTDSGLIKFADLFGKHYYNDLCPIDYSYSSFTIRGFVSMSTINNKSLQFLYINKRPLLKCKLHKLINDMFSKSGFLLDKNCVSCKESPPNVDRRFVIYVLNICCPCGEYEVFSEPNKTIVEFKNWDEINECLRGMIVEFTSSRMDGMNSKERTYEQNEAAEQNSCFNPLDKQFLKHSIRSRHVKRFCDGQMKSDSFQPEDQTTTLSKETTGDPASLLHVETAEDDDEKSKLIRLKEELMCHSLQDFKQLNRNKSHHRLSEIIGNRNSLHDSVLGVHGVERKEFTKIYSDREDVSEKTIRDIHYQNCCKKPKGRKFSNLQKLTIRKKKTIRLDCLKRFIFCDGSSQNRNFGENVSKHSKHKKLKLEPNCKCSDSVTGIKTSRNNRTFTSLKIKPRSFCDQQISDAKNFTELDFASDCPEDDRDDRFIVSRIFFPNSEENNSESQKSVDLIEVEASRGNDRDKGTREDPSDPRKLDSLLGVIRSPALKNDSQCEKLLMTKSMEFIRVNEREIDDFVRVLRADLSFTFPLSRWWNCIGCLLTDNLKSKTLKILHFAAVGNFSNLMNHVTDGQKRLVFTEDKRDDEDSPSHYKHRSNSQNHLTIYTLLGKLLPENFAFLTKTRLQQSTANRDTLLVLNENQSNNIEDKIVAKMPISDLIPSLGETKCVKPCKENIDCEIVDSWVSIPDEHLGKQLYVHQLTGNTMFPSPPKLMTADLSDETGLDDHKKCFGKFHNIVNKIRRKDDVFEHENEQKQPCREELENLKSLKLFKDYENWKNLNINHFEKEPSNILIASRRPSAVRAHNIIHPFKFITSDLNKLKVINQIDSKFIACLMESRPAESHQESLLLILFDQHAVHERIRLEHFLLGSKENRQPSGHNRRSFLTDPLKINLQPFTGEFVEPFASSFAAWGFRLSFSPINRHIVYVHTIPEYLRGKEKTKLKSQIEKILKDGLALIQEGKNLKNVMSKSLLSTLASRACHGAVKFGDKLSLNDCEVLLDLLRCCNLPFQCAHGRPSLVPLVDLKHIRKNNFKVPKKLIFDEEKILIVSGMNSGTQKQLCQHLVVVSSSCSENT